MPSLPKWINDTVENVWSSKFKDCKIIHIESISGNLRLIRFETDLQDIQYEPGYAIGIRINDRDFRNYSPFNFNREAGTFEVLFHIHDDSAVGSCFAAHLSVGDSIKILIPRGKRFFEPNAKIHFSIGDEPPGQSLFPLKKLWKKPVLHLSVFMSWKSPRLWKVSIYMVITVPKTVQ
jgi:hypothetical protein